MSTQTKFVLSANFKVLRKGDGVKPSEHGGEFLYITHDGEDDFTLGQLEEIAKSNSLKVSAKKKADFKSKLDKELENMNDVAEQNGPTQSEIVEDIIRDGVEQEKSDDEMMIEIIQAGVSFRSAGKIFKQKMEELGLRASTKTVKESANEILTDMDFEPETYEDVEEAIKKIMDEVEGAEKRQALTAVRAYCKANEIEMPKRPKGRRGAAGFKGKVFNFILDNPEATEDDLAEFGENEGKDAEKIKKQFGPFLKVCHEFAKKHGEAFAE